MRRSHSQRLKEIVRAAVTRFKARGATPIPEKEWFDLFQKLLLQIANTHDGRELLCIDHDLPRLIAIAPNSVTWDAGNGQLTTEFRTHSKYAKVVRHRWREFQAYARQFYRAELYGRKILFPILTLPGGLQVAANTVDTFYPDADPETSTFDGYVRMDEASYGSTLAQWRTNVRNVTTGTSVVHAASPLLAMYNITQTGDGTVTRNALLFDTTSLTINAAISAVALSLYATAKTVSDTTQDLNITSSNPASNTVIATSDYDIATKWGTTRFVTSDISVDSISTGAYQAFNLNATGIAAINTTGITKLALMNGEDLDDVRPTEFNAGFSNNIEFSSAEHTGTSQDPKLEVTYTIFNAPTALSVTGSDGSTSLNLSWTDNSSDEDGFSIERSNDGTTGWTEIHTTSAGVQTYADPVGTNSTTRYYRVRAFKTGPIYSQYTSVQSATTCPPAPSNLDVQPVSGNHQEMALTWDDNSSDETSFSIERSLDGMTGWAQVLTPAANAESATDTGLSGETVYYYRIRAIRSGDGIDSEYSTADSNITAPNPPSTAAAVGVSGTTDISVTWDEISGVEDGYYVERSDDGVGGWSVISSLLPPDTEQYTDAVGTHSTTKYYRVRGISDGVYSDYTNTGAGKTSSPAPSSCAVAPVTQTYNMQVTWADNSSDETGFSIERSNNGSSGWAEVGTVGAGILTFTDTTLGVGDTVRYYRVRAIRSGDGVYSPYSNTDNDTSAPQEPTLFVVAFSNLLATLTWADNSALNTSYTLERKRESAAYATVTTSITANAVTYADTTELDPNHTYTYRIKAVRSGDSMESPLVTVSAPVPPEEPTNLRAFTTNDKTGNVSVRLMWDKNSRYETGTKIERSINGSDWSTVTTTSKGATTYEDTGLVTDTLYYYRVSAVGSVATSTTTSTTVRTKLNNTAGLSYAFLKKVRSFPRE